MPKAVRRKKIYRYLLLGAPLLFLSVLCTAGCGKRSVDYIAEEQDTADAAEYLNTGTRTGGSLWEESFAVEKENGDTVTIKVKVAVGSGPDSSQVVGVRRVALDETARERIASAALGDGASFADGVYRGSRDEIPYRMRIGENRISLYPEDMTQLAPDELKDSLNCHLEGGGGTSGGGYNGIMEEDEGAELAAQFLEELGFSDRNLVETKCLGWNGEVEYSPENSYVSMGMMEGYIYYFEQKLQGEPVIPVTEDTDIDGFWLWQEGEEYDGLYDAKMHTIVCVKDYKIIAADIQNIYEITSVDEDVRLLPVETVQGILQNELAEPDTYLANEEGTLLYYWGLMHRYCLLWDDTGKNGSYVPIWELQGGETDGTNIVVNAIDGSVVTWEQRNRMMPVNPAAED